MLSYGNNRALGDGQARRAARDGIMRGLGGDGRQRADAREGIRWERQSMNESQTKAKTKRRWARGPAGANKQGGL